MTDEEIQRLAVLLDEAMTHGSKGAYFDEEVSDHGDIVYDGHFDMRKAARYLLENGIVLPPEAPE